MNIDQISTIVLQVLITIAPKIANGAFEELGAKVWDAPSKLYHLIKQRFSKNPETDELLQRLIKSPQKKKNQEVFKSTLIKFAEEEPKFADEIETKFVGDVINDPS